jgi:hypothetical protein
MEAVRQGLLVAELQAIATVVRYYEGSASAAEFGAATRDLVSCREFAADWERTRARERLFEFPLRPEPLAPPSCH